MAFGAVITYIEILPAPKIVLKKKFMLSVQMVQFNSNSNPARFPPISVPTADEGTYSDEDDEILGFQSILPLAQSEVAVDPQLSSCLGGTYTLLSLIFANTDTKSNLTSTSHTTYLIL